MSNFDSKTQAHIDKVCERGLESYLATQRKGYRKKQIEEGLLGSFVGAVGIVAMSQIPKTGVKIQYAIYPLVAGLLVGGISAITLSEYNDEELEDDFNQFCDEQSEENL
tara:strand:- start:789 stop:1115 length:327 start_codon:yes stop_codon:yes gene_type:complete